MKLMGENKLTEKEHWDNYWREFDLPVELIQSPDNLLINEELNLFNTYFPKDPLSVLEIGGAPGQYLVYLSKQFGYQVNCLDYSEVGCQKTIENFKLFNIPVTVYQKDIFKDLKDIPRFDMVYSMGLAEHFNDLSGIVEKHLDLLKPGGILMIGMPNFLGINHFFLKRLAPSLVEKHNLESMDIKNWKKFENEFKLETIFKAYVGGFEPSTFLVREKTDFVNNILFLKARILNRIFHKNFRFLRRFNSKHFSGYMIGIYRKPKE